jgi:hypothetical protein
MGGKCVKGYQDVVYSRVRDCFGGLPIPVPPYLICDRAYLSHRDYVYTCACNYIFSASVVSRSRYLNVNAHKSVCVQVYMCTQYVCTHACK